MQGAFDANWRRRAMRGEEQAIGMLAADMLDPLYRFCFYRVGRNRALCEEVVQETLIRAIRDLQRYEPARCRNDIFPWLSGLARNEIRKALARETSAASLEALWARMDDDLRRVFAQLESDPLGDEALRREETREVVNATMSQLPTHYREALEEKYVFGKSVRDIAAALSMTEKAVESQLTRARRAFRETFLALARNLELEAR